MNEKSPRPTVCTGASQSNYRRLLAYQRLGIDPEDVQRVPFFAADLKRIARIVCGSGPADKTARALDYLRWSEDPEVRKVLEVYLSVAASYRRLLPPEAFCQAAGVSPRQVLQSIAAAAVSLGLQGSAIVAAVMLPDVVQKLIDKALRDNGDAARTTFLKATG